MFFLNEAASTKIKLQYTDSEIVENMEFPFLKSLFCENAPYLCIHICFSVASLSVTLESPENIQKINFYLFTKNQ